MLQTLWPVLRFEYAKEGDNCLTGSIPDHGRTIAESVESGDFDIVCDIWGSTGDESGIVLEQIASNRPDTILLLWEGAEDVDKVSDVLWSTRKVVKFLSFGFRGIRLVLNGEGQNGRLTTVISR
jgi:hypothetical protein